MKKTYIQPTIQIVPVRHTSIICSSTPEVRGVSSNDADITYGGGGSGAARVKDHGAWDEEW